MHSGAGGFSSHGPIGDFAPHAPTSNTIATDHLMDVSPGRQTPNLDHQQRPGPLSRERKGSNREELCAEVDRPWGWPSHPALPTRAVSAGPILRVAVSGLAFIVE